MDYTDCADNVHDNPDVPRPPQFA